MEEDITEDDGDEKDPQIEVQDDGVVELQGNLLI